jgi:hypothetical protein
MSILETVWKKDLKASTDNFFRRIPKDLRCPVIEQDDLLLGIDCDNAILGDVEDLGKLVSGNAREHATSESQSGTDFAATLNRR